MQQIITTLNNGIQMPLLGLGVYDMYRKEAEEAIQSALQVGYRLIDTASMYQNENEVGNAIRTSAIKRNEIFLTTKVNNGDQGYESTLKAFEVSKRKLNVEYVDMYLIHWPVRPHRKETWKALEKLYQEKQVRSIGVSNYNVQLLTEMEDYSEIVPVVNQVEFSPYLFPEDLLLACQKKKIQVQAYSPLVRGTGLSDSRLIPLASKYNKTSAQIIIRWALQLGVSTIPKSSNPMRQKENFDVFDFELSSQSMTLLNRFRVD